MILQLKKTTSFPQFSLNDCVWFGSDAVGNDMKFAFQFETIEISKVYITADLSRAFENDRRTNEKTQPLSCTASNLLTSQSTSLVSGKRMFVFKLKSIRKTVFTKISLLHTYTHTHARAPQPASQSTFAQPEQAHTTRQSVHTCSVGWTTEKAMVLHAHFSSSRQTMTMTTMAQDRTYMHKHSYVYRGWIEHHQRQQHSEFYSPKNSTKQQQSWIVCTEREWKGTSSMELF